MITGTIGSKVSECFSVVDVDGPLVSGINTDSFFVDLFNPDKEEVSDSIIVPITELGSGHYVAEFIPNKAGMWYMSVYHDQYFPWGKSDDIQVYTSDLSTIADNLTRVVGLTQENYCLDNTAYINYYGSKLLTSGRLRIYSNSASVGTDLDVIANYQIISTWDNNELKMYKVIKQ
jgi:hypothetical protein